MSGSMRSTVLVHRKDVVIETYVEGTGPSIVMLPSTGRDGGEDFDHTAARLAASGFTVLRPQPRGIGQSTGPMAGVSLHDMADDVAAVIIALGDGRAVILGHAFGHFIARMTAVDHPAAVRGIVLAAAAASSYPAAIAATPRIAGSQDAPEIKRLAALQLGFFAPGHDPAPWLQGWYPATQRMQADCREKAGVVQSDWWEGGTAPFLELIPEHDPFKPPQTWGEMREAYGERVTTIMIPGASHALFPEQPDAVADAIATWMGNLLP
jgi:pimeloyl-ACP methyl ester carboxylesterase